MGLGLAGISCFCAVIPRGAQGKIHGNPTLKTLQWLGWIKHY